MTKLNKGLANLSGVCYNHHMRIYKTEEEREKAEAEELLRMVRDYLKDMEVKKLREENCKQGAD